MGAFYGRKILSGEVNPKTCESWKLEDVPSFWLIKTEAWINKNNSNKNLYNEGLTVD